MSTRVSAFEPQRPFRQLTRLANGNVPVRVTRFRRGERFGPRAQRGHEFGIGRDRPLERRERFDSPFECQQGQPQIALPLCVARCASRLDIYVESHNAIS